MRIAPRIPLGFFEKLKKESNWKIVLRCFGAPLGMLGVSLGAPFGVNWSVLGSFGGLVGSLGSLGVSLGGRWDSWSLRGRFPGFSGKLWEPFWSHFGTILGTFCDPKSPSKFD